MRQPTKAMVKKVSVPSVTRLTNHLPDVHSFCPGWDPEIGGVHLLWSAKWIRLQASGSMVQGSGCIIHLNIAAL